MLLWEKHFKIDGGEAHSYMALLCVRGRWELRCGFVGRLVSHSLSEQEALALVGEYHADIARRESSNLLEYLDDHAAS